MSPTCNNQSPRRRRTRPRAKYSSAMTLTGTGSRCVHIGYRETMPHASHRLDLYLVPMKPAENLASALDDLWVSLVLEQVIDALGWAGPAASSWVLGGFGRMRIDRFDQPRIFANQQGGYRVHCPQCGASAVRSLQLATQNGRHEAKCDNCGTTTGLNDLEYAPPAAFGRFAVVFTEAEDANPTPGALAALLSALCPCRLVWRRT